MNIFESIVSAFSSVFSNKMRTFLTMLGIIIGISAVIMITSIGQGFKSALNEEFSGIGSNVIAIYLMSWNQVVKDSDELDMDDVDLMYKHPNIEYVAPRRDANCSVELKNPENEQSCYILGTTAEYKNSFKSEMLYGRFLNERDYATNSKVVVIDEWLAQSAFGRKDVLGEKIKMKFSNTDEYATIVGVLKSEKGQTMSVYSSSTAYMPINALNDIMDDDKEIEYLYAGVKDTSKLQQTTGELIKLIEVKHKNEDKYRVESYMDQVNMINNSLNMVTSFISFVAAISLIVGGVGVMNIMLVTVTERTREIGIRKSLGATNSNIRTQFLIEAMILSFLGGLIGIVFGYLGGVGVASIITKVSTTAIRPIISVPVVLGTVIISSLIGIIFGVYPAGKAAKLDPIEALRYE